MLRDWVQYLAVAVDAAHFTPRLDARMPFFAVLENVAFESTSAGRENVHFPSDLGFFAQQLFVGQHLTERCGRWGGRSRCCWTLFATGHRIRPISFALRTAERRTSQLGAFHFQS